MEWVRRIFRAQSLDEERTLMLNAEEWPIACKVNFGPTTELGEPVASAPAKVWREQLAQVADLGFKYIDPMDDWVPLADLDAGRFAQFRQVLTDTHLSVAAISIGRHSIVDVDRGRENLQTIHRTIDRAAELGASVVDLGFMQALTPAQRGHCGSGLPRATMMTRRFVRWPSNAFGSLPTTRSAGDRAEPRDV